MPISIELTEEQVKKIGAQLLGELSKVMGKSISSESNTSPYKKKEFKIKNRIYRKKPEIRYNWKELKQDVNNILEQMATPVGRHVIWDILKTNNPVYKLLPEGTLTGVLSKMSTAKLIKIVGKQGQKNLYASINR